MRILKASHNYIADLSDKKKIASLYKEPYKFCLGEEKRDLPNKSHYLRVAVGIAKVVQDNLTMNDIRHLVGPHDSLTPLVKFLRSLGYHGLRSKESGELVFPLSKPPFPWVEAFGYIVFDPDDIEIIEEEHFTIKDGKAIKL